MTLKTLASLTALAVMLTGGASPAWADPADPHSWMMRHCDHQRMDMPYEHIKDNLCYWKAELRISDVRMAAWNEVAEVARSNATAVALMDAETKEADGDVALLRVIERREKMMASLLVLLHKFDAALSPLYTLLNGTQRHTADELIKDMCPPQ